MKVVILTAIAISSLATVVSAQTLGEIVGDVKDASGAVIAGAEVIATRVATNAARTTQSNNAGMYSFPGLVPGEYTVRVQTSGFRTSIPR